jgi:hypothetical protein
LQLQIENDPPVFSVETQSIAPIAEEANADSGGATTIEDFGKSATRDRVQSQTTPAAITAPSTTIASVQQKRSHLPICLRPFINFIGKWHNQSAIASHMRL